MNGPSVPADGSDTPVYALAHTAESQDEAGTLTGIPETDVPNAAISTLRLQSEPETTRTESARCRIPFPIGKRISDTADR